MAILEANKPDMEGKEGLEALFRFATEGIIVVDSSGAIVNANPSAERMFGYEQGELVGKKVEALVPSRFSNHNQKRDNFTHNPHARPMGLGIDLYGCRKDKSEFPVEISLSPYVYGGNRFVIGFIIDITRRKEAEDRLKQYSAELEKQVEKRTMIMREAIQELERTRDELNVALEKEKELGELKTRFVSMASHEFRTPLATILSSLSLVSKYGESGEKDKQGKHVTRIKGAVSHLTDILNDVLSISRLEEGRISMTLEEIDIRELINNVLNEMRPICKDAQTINYQHKGDTLVRLDRKIIRNIIFNLVSNAIKFSNEGKQISIETISSEHELMLTVQDEGMGISAEDQKHLFERFFRGHNATNVQGTGLGLNIVAKYVELMDGHIEFESELEKGTKFILIFRKHHEKNSVD
jgi:PAS domain S-box-containing protein